MFLELLLDMPGHNRYQQKPQPGIAAKIGVYTRHASHAPVRRSQARPVTARHGRPSNGQGSLTPACRPEAVRCGKGALEKRRRRRRAGQGGGSDLEHARRKKDKGTGQGNSERVRVAVWHKPGNRAHLDWKLGHIGRPVGCLLDTFWSINATSCILLYILRTYKTKGIHFNQVAGWPCCNQ